MTQSKIMIFDDETETIRPATLDEIAAAEYEERRRQAPAVHLASMIVMAMAGNVYPYYIGDPPRRPRYIPEPEPIRVTAEDHRRTEETIAKAEAKRERRRQRNLRLQEK